MARLIGSDQSWGIPTFAIGATIAVVLATAGARGLSLLAVGIPIGSVTIIGVIGAMVAAWFSVTSYPRVHNFKVYALGFSIAAVVGGLAVGTAIGGDASRAAIPLAYAGAYVALTLTSAGPDYAGYRVTVRVAAVAAALIAFAFAAVLSIPRARADLAAVLPQIHMVENGAFLAFAALSAAVVVLSVVTERHTSGIGGLHAGAVLLLTAGWLVPAPDISHHLAGLYALPIYVAIGTLVHWFRRLENRASYDPLLRIYNRGFCEQVIEERSKLDTRPPFAVALADLDHFKAVNDTWGHDAGDAVLHETAQRVRTIVVPRGTVGRFGGEELIVFMPRTGLEAARALMNQVREAVASEPVNYNGTSIPVTLSIGISIRELREQPVGAVVTGADKALYAAKNRGRNQVRTSRLRRRE